MRLRGVFKPMLQFIIRLVGHTYTVYYSYFAFRNIRRALAETIQSSFERSFGWTIIHLKEITNSEIQYTSLNPRTRLERAPATACCIRTRRFAFENFKLK